MVCERNQTPNSQTGHVVLFYSKNSKAGIMKWQYSMGDTYMGGQTIKKRQARKLLSQKSERWSPQGIRGVVTG